MTESRANELSLARVTREYSMDDASTESIEIAKEFRLFRIAVQQIAAHITGADQPNGKVYTRASREQINAAKLVMARLIQYHAGEFERWSDLVRHVAVECPSVSEVTIRRWGQLQQQWEASVAREPRAREGDLGFGELS